MRFFQKIRGRLVLASLLMIFPSFFIMIFYSLAYVYNEQRSRDVYLVNEGLDHHEEMISHYYKDARSDIIFLSKTPPVDGILRAEANNYIDPEFNISIDVWLDRMAVFYQSLLETREMWFQACFIDRDGNVLLKVKNNNGHMSIEKFSDSNALNNEFFLKVRQQNDANLLVSDIHLNRSDGIIDMPYRPVIMFSIPILDENNQFSGAIILRGNVKSFLIPRWVEDQKYWLMMIDQNGNYIVNQKYPTKEWGGEKNLNNGMNAKNDFGQNYEYLLSGSQNRFMYENEAQVFNVKKIQSTFDKEHYYYVVYVTSQNITGKGVMNILIVTFVVLFLGFISSVGVSLLTSKTFSEPLLQILDSVISFREGKTSVRSPIAGPLEMQQLGKCINEMADNIVRRQQTLEKEVDERTLELVDSRRAALSMMQDAHIQRERAEQVLEQLESANREMITLSRAIEQSPIMILIINIEGHIVYANPNFYETTGFESEDIIDQPSKILYAANQPTGIDIEKLCHDVVNGQDWVGETVNVKKDGSSYWEFSSISPVRNDEQEITGFVAVKEDITERKKAAFEMKKAKDAAESANKAKSSFLANMSHEIRTPMNAILGMSHLLYKTGLNAHQAEYVKKIENALKNLLGIINDILDFSKIEAGKMELEKATFKLDLVLENMIDLIQPKIREKDIELIVYKTPDVPDYLLGDQLRLGQILLNLVNNAVKFTHDGEIIVFIEKMPDQNDGQISLKFSVKDSGVGMTSQQVSKLFEAFRQADISITREYGGTGLGLTISKKLVEMMNGHIWVDSEFGKGSDFQFTIELGLAADKPIKSDYQHDKMQNMHVLIIDDNETTRNIISDMLQSFNIQSTALGSSDELIEHYKHAENLEKYDVALLDWKLPDMNGIDAFTVLQGQHEVLPPFILMSVFSTEIMREEAHLCGFWDILAKPISRDQLFNALLNLVKRNREQMATRSQPDNIADQLEPIRGARLLLVEDNEINRQVATEILNYEGFDIDIAENGKIATEKINENGTYDLVLMDLHMPVMDGFTATQEIRKNDHFKNLPIVAMTADAIVGVQQQCFSVGMNDYLTKPVNPVELFNILVKWIEPVSKTKQELGATRAHAQTQKQVPSVIDALQRTAGLNVDQALNRLNNNVQLYSELIGKFKRNYEHFQSDLETFLLENNITEARRLAHTLKGIAGNLGFDALHSKSNALQKAIEENEHKKIQTTFAHVIQEINVIFGVISKTDSNVSEKVEILEDKNVDKKKLLSELSGLLQKHDIGAKQYFKENIAGFMAIMDKKDYTLFEEKIEQYNFGAAEEIINAINETA